MFSKKAWRIRKFECFWSLQRSSRKSEGVVFGRREVSRSKNWCIRMNQTTIGLRNSFFTVYLTKERFEKDRGRQSGPDYLIEIMKEVLNELTSSELKTAFSGGFLQLVSCLLLLMSRRPGLCFFRAQHLSNLLLTGLQKRFLMSALLNGSRLEGEEGTRFIVRKSGVMGKVLEGAAFGILDAVQGIAFGSVVGKELF